MPTWGQILNELNQTTTVQGGIDYDSVRRKYLAALHRQTGRAVILYSTAFLESRAIPPLDLPISLFDVQGLMEVVSGIKERKLDLIIHSPGGSAEAAESMVNYLRTRFDHIRAFVPLAAMSAATMLALSADEVIMGAHSQLGPIDPQFNIVTPEGPRSAPAKAILDQFEKAKEECKDPNNLPAWMPILRSYAPGLLAQCEDQQDLAREMVSKWLSAFMFKDEPNGPDKATSIADWFANYDNFRAHGRGLRIDQVREQGVKVSPLEDDNNLQDAILSVHHASIHSFSGTGAVKIIENHIGHAFVRVSGQVVMEQRSRATQPQTPPKQPQPNRAARRRKT